MGGRQEEVGGGCEKLGEAVVQAKLESEHFGTGKAFAWEWLLEQHYRRRREGESQERERAERVLKVAEDSASAARAAAAGAQCPAPTTIVGPSSAGAAVRVSSSTHPPNS